jgi:Integrase core domain
VQEIGELTVSDVWGPTRVQSIHRNSYYISFTDAKSHRSQIYFMKNKSQALQKFKYYKSFMETQKNIKLKILRTDNGGEYLSEDFKHYCKEAGIRLQYTTPDSPVQNRIQKGLTNHLLNMAKPCYLRTIFQ